MKSKNEQKREPKYLSVYRKLRKDIVNGIYKYGEKLPSKRVLADSMDISVITAEHVYNLLIDEGYAESRERSGIYCAFNKNDRFLFSVKEEDFLPEKPETEPETNGFPAGLYAKAARQVLSRYGENIFSKCEGSGTFLLRNEISLYLERSRGIKTEASQIIIGAGAEYLYGIIVELLGRDKVYAAEDPSYEKIEQVYRSKGVKCEMLPLGKNGIKSSALSKTSADVLHITPYRSFPSGVTADASKRLEYAKWGKNNGRYIVEDDFESEFTVTGKIYDTVFSSSESENVIYLNTFSKTVSPSIRMAFMVLPQSLVKVFNEKLGFYSCTVSVFEQYIMASLLKSGEFERHINRTRRRLRKEKSE